MNKGWKKEWLRLKVEKESGKGEKLGKRKEVQKLQKVSKSGEKVKTWAPSQQKVGRKAKKRSFFKFAQE